MRILAQPFPSRSILLAVVRHLASMRIVERECLLDPVSRQIRKGMPSPLRLRGERKFLVVVGEGLQPGRVDGECKRTITDTER